MSKKKFRKQQQRKKFPWALVTIGSVLLILAVFLFANQSNGDSGGIPAIVVDQAKIDYGYVQFGNNKTFAIKVTNTGTGTLRFKEKPLIQVLEGC